MQRENRYTYNKRIELNEKFLKELYDLLIEYCEKIDFSAKTKNDSTIKFDSFEELLKYSNYKDEKIKALFISARTDKQNDKINIDFGDQLLWDRDTITCRYTIADENHELAFINKFQKIIDKMTQRNGMLYTGTILMIIPCLACMNKIMNSPANFVPDEILGWYFILISLVPISVFFFALEILEGIFSKIQTFNRRRN